MSPELKILRDLQAGQSTADSIAPRIGLPTAATEAILRRLKTEGKIKSRPLGGVLQNVPIFQLSSNAERMRAEQPK